MYRPPRIYLLVLVGNRLNANRLECTVVHLLVVDAYCKKQVVLCTTGV
jgi:hypothetical protein